MCGIVGFIGKDYTTYLSSMNDSQIHRGPDDRGEFHSDNFNVGLAMTRLAIVDIDSGSQPMTDAETGVTIVFNGEIFNHYELRKYLIGLNHKFYTISSDTEVILRSYLNDGFDCIKKLNGMFSFAIFDPRIETIFLGRDRYGIKPLYYSLLNDNLLFSSEIRAILKTGLLNKKISIDALSHYLSLQYIPSPFTIYEDIHKIPQGSYATFSLTDKSFKITKYWEPIPIENNQTFSHTRLKDITESSVIRWLNSDVPVASSLSGGIDSTIVSSIASRHCSLSTYALGFKDGVLSEMDETSVAAQTAKILNTDHHEIIISEKTFIESFEDMLDALEEPYGGGLPSYFIYQEVKKNHKVLLTGTGGDELFGNYGKHNIHNLNPIYPYRLFKRIHHNGLLETLLHPNGSLYNNFSGESLKKKLLNQKAKSTVQFIDLYWKKYNLSKNNNSKIKFIDFQFQLPNEFLHMTDKFSMYHSVEARTPLLDNELVDFVFENNLKINKHYSLKEHFIKANKIHLRDEIIKKPKKGFILPNEYWMKTILLNHMDLVFNKDFIKKQNIFNYTEVQDVLYNFKKGKNSQFLWTLFMFQSWYKFVYLN